MERGRKPRIDAEPVKKYSPTGEAIIAAKKNSEIGLHPWNPVPDWLDTSSIPEDLIVTVPIGTIIPASLLRDAERQKNGTPQETNEKTEKRKPQVPQQMVDTISKVLFQQPVPEPQIPREEMINPNNPKPVSHFGARNEFLAGKNTRSRPRGPGSRNG